MSAPAASPAASTTPAAAVASAWDDARKRHPAGTKLLRVIDLAAMTQRFDVLPAEPGEVDLDGCTLLIPALARTDEERLLIVQVYDRLWLERPDR